ncbi:hypothetical protein GCM10027059_27900 [Myceligenerans halotolerans]
MSEAAGAMIVIACLIFVFVLVLPRRFAILTALAGLTLAYFPAIDFLERGNLGPLMLVAAVAVLALVLKLARRDRGKPAFVTSPPPTVSGAIVAAENSESRHGGLTPEHRKAAFDFVCGKLEEVARDLTVTKANHLIGVRAGERAAQAWRSSARTRILDEAVERIVGRTLTKEATQAFERALRQGVVIAAPENQAAALEYVSHERRQELWTRFADEVERLAQEIVIIHG